MTTDSDTNTPTQSLVSKDQLPGVWRRDLIETPETEDKDSIVFWVQGKTIYGDLRVEPSGIIAFSGRLTQSGSVFKWNMDLMSFDQPEFPDAGRLEWKADELWEYGVHQTYTELWRKASSPVSGDFARWYKDALGVEASHLKIGTFEFAMVGSSSAIVLGTCPRFGVVEQRFGDAQRLDQFRANAAQAVNPWDLIAEETF